MKFISRYKARNEKAKQKYEEALKKSKQEGIREILHESKGFLSEKTILKPLEGKKVKIPLWRFHSEDGKATNTYLVHETKYPTYFYNEQRLIFSGGFVFETEDERFIRKLTRDSNHMLDEEEGLRFWTYGLKDLRIKSPLFSWFFTIKMNGKSTGNLCSLGVRGDNIERIIKGLCRKKEGATNRIRKVRDTIVENGIEIVENEKYPDLRTPYIYLGRSRNLYDLGRYSKYGEHICTTDRDGIKWHYQLRDAYEDAGELRIAAGLNRTINNQIESGID